MKLTHATREQRTFSLILEPQFRGARRQRIPFPLAVALVVVYLSTILALALFR